ncbi:unnamed protein product [Bursaphelenchus xylophilus]|nr:unnamed protein product [Bursaphelenchus xylophilus]CAG9083644.1 unnamed protein product [Bursaphelenchus xylophilus]
MAQTSNSVQNPDNPPKTTQLRWLEDLEKDFDKAFVEMDLTLGEIDADQADIAYECRQKMTAISSCFAQMVCKCQTLAHKNNRLTDQVEEYRDMLAGVNALCTVAERESRDLTLQIHSLQCQLYSRTAPHESDMLRKKIDQEIQHLRNQQIPAAKAEAQVEILTKENHKLRQMLGSMQSEVYAARLAAKYLDKELAGRIQQIQLLGRDMRGAEHDRLWNQLEAEIHLHRHKTVIRACRGRLRNSTSHSTEGPTQLKNKLNKNSGKMRVVKLVKEPTEGLGISITGGREHGVPILISEIHPGQPAERCGKMYVGDTILSVNGINLRSVKHNEAVQILSKQMMENRELEFEVVFISPDPDSDDENDVTIEGEDGSTFNLYENMESPEAMHVNSSTCSANSGRSSVASSTDPPHPISPSKEP